MIWITTNSYQTICWTDGACCFYGQKSDLTQVPNDIPEKVTEVYLWSNRISTLNANIFSHLVNCTKGVLLYLQKICNFPNGDKIQTHSPFILLWYHRQFETGHSVVINVLNFSFLYYCILQMPKAEIVTL